MTAVCSVEDHLVLSKVLEETKLRLDEARVRAHNFELDRDCIRRKLAEVEVARDEIEARFTHLAQGFRKTGWVKQAEVVEATLAFPDAGIPVVTVVSQDRDRLQEEVERFTRESAEVRRMFDLTRHRICDRLGVEHGKSWSSVEDLVATVTRERDEARQAAHALLSDTRTLARAEAAESELVRLRAAPAEDALPLTFEDAAREVELFTPPGGGTRAEERLLVVLARHFRSKQQQISTTLPISRVDAGSEALSSDSIMDGDLTKKK